eukprot:8635959-Pyramimonas_sp.AAC.1
MARRLLMDPNASLRESLMELLFKDEEFQWGRLENLLREGGKESDFNAIEVRPPPWAPSRAPPLVRAARCGGTMSSGAMSSGTILAAQ